MTGKWEICLDAMKAIQQEMMSDSKGISERSTKNALRNGSSIKELFRASLKSTLKNLELI